MNLFFKDKRGVSEIVGSLVLILIVSIGGALLYSLSLQSFSSASSLYGLDTGNREDQARERFLIISVHNTTTMNQVNLTVLNYGEIEVTLAAAYVQGTNVTYLTGNGNSVGAGQLVTIQFTSTVPIQSQSTYEILVVSTRGGTNAVFWEA